ncbi:MAG: single-stranded DNA-binding protein [Chloroflexi bacterium]|nr:single-stranded DNA-binding protein [Chloroflexota bacterium]
MARGLNKVMIIGNVGRDPEMRYTPSGKPVANFSVAVNRNWRTPEGETREETEWFRIEAWDRLGETCNEYLKKGMRVYVEGRLRTREYDDRNGQKRTAVEIIANEMMMLDSRDQSRGGGERAIGEGRPAGAPEADGGDDIDEMPF